MIFGKPRLERYHRDWRPYFAWFPAELIGGGFVWLEVYEGKWVSNLKGGFWFICREAGCQDDPFADPTTPPPKPRH